MGLYHIFHVFISHFLTYYYGMTFLNYYKGIIPMLWILKKWWTKDGLTWSSLMDLTIKTWKVNPILKSSTWIINGNVSRKQTYLFNFVIIMRSSMRPVLLLRIKMSTQMCQSASSGCTFLQCHACNMWFLSHKWNIFPNSGLRSTSPYKSFSNLSFFSFHKSPHDASIEKI